MWIVTLVLVLVTSPAFAQLQVDSAGRVGLGTTAPATRLHVIDTGTPLGSAGIDGQLIIQNSGTVGDGGVLSLIGGTEGTAQIMFGNTANESGAGRFRYQHAGLDDDSMIFQVGGTSRMTLGSSGAVVEGNISATGSIISGGTTLNVPDYVFEEGYELPPLSEVKDFVLREKHLPDIPSAAEIGETGVNITEMQMKLLAKVEELTLYTIAQDKTITGQERALTALAATIQELAARLAVVEHSVSTD